MMNKLPTIFEHAALIVSCSGKSNKSSNSTKGSCLCATPNKILKPQKSSFLFQIKKMLEASSFCVPAKLAI